MRRTIHQHPTISTSSWKEGAKFPRPTVNQATRQASARWVVVVDDWPGTSQILKTADKTWFTRATWVRGQCLAEWAVHPGLLGSHRLSWKRSNQYMYVYIYISGFYNINIYIYFTIIWYIWQYIYGYTVVIYIYSGWLLLLVAWDSLSPLQQYRLCLSPNSFRLVFKDTFAANNGKSQFLRGKLTISMALFNSFLYVY